MFYEFAVTAPPSTSSEDPVIETVNLVPGVITFVEVQFPRGCAGLVHASVRNALHQVWPTNQDGDIAGDDARVSWDEQYDLDAEPYALSLVVWNEDDTFPHTVSFRFAEINAVDFAAQLEGLHALQYLNRWFALRTPQPIA